MCRTITDVTDDALRHFFGDAFGCFKGLVVYGGGEDYVGVVLEGSREGG